jgi:gamma-glutamyltranspeptidase/glutathione hydrolase
MVSLLPRPRAAVRAEHGVVATSHPVAAEVGRDVLRAGGSAVDAAVATAAALTVVEPTSNGLGGDAFALVWDGQALHGYNGSGRAPSALTVDAVRARGHDGVPLHGWAPVTVPGQIRAWADLHARFGRLPWDRVLEPAVRLAADGCPVPPVVAHYWERGVAAASRLEGAAHAGFLPTFAPTGRAPRAGETVRLPGHARTLTRLAEHGADDFYAGEIGHAIAEFASASGGFLTSEDLATHVGEWTSPVTTAYQGYAVAEIPPNGQGIAALIALGILDGLDLGPDPSDPAVLHLQIEAMRLAFADTFAHVGDPQHVEVPTSGLLDPGYLARRRALIGEQAATVRAGSPPRGGTVLLCAADVDGVMASLIQSNFHGFGSGVVVPAWGIALQNRGSGFVLDPSHPNALAPGRRPFHTIIPGFLLRRGGGGADRVEPVGPFGVMGGHMQAQGHVQVVLHTAAGADPQEALDAPRWRVEGDVVLLEPGLAHAADELTRRGHSVRVGADGGFGRGQAIWHTGEGPHMWIAGSETRCDGLAAGY